MKLLTSVLALVIAVSASAHDMSDWFRSEPMPTADSSWEEILNDSRIFVNVPILRRNDGLVISTLKACYNADEDTFMSTVPYKKRECLRWDRGSKEREPRCVVYSDYEYYYAEIPANQTRRECKRYSRSKERHDCVEYGERAYRLKLDHTVKVFRKVRGNKERNDRAGAFLFKKDINIPQCNDLSSHN